MNSVYRVIVEGKRMKAPSIASRILLVLISTVLLLLSATLAWGLVLDYQARGLVPKGVSVVGHDLSGMTEAQARAAIDEAVSTPMLRPLTVTAKKKTWTLDPPGIVKVDVDSMINSAYEPRRAATLVQRLNSELTGELLPADIKPVYTVDNSAITSWVAQTAKQIDRKPVNAKRLLVVSKYRFKIKKSVKGAKVNQAKSVAEIAHSLSADAALSSAERVAALPVKTLKPKVVESSFKTAIFVSLNRCRIYLYHGAKLVKSYSCAPGQPAYPTPTGDFHVQSKQSNAPWINPGTAWAASMPQSIPPGPGNPMGVRKIGINYPGVFMHGVPPGEYGSIGTHASHGCMRMLPSQVLDLFGRVKIGDPVIIRD
jgi:lipoprotein-anchoring transpeptidase ErfK/SrfK